MVEAQNLHIQNILENYFADTENLSEKFKDGLNYSMVISDSNSGNLLAIVGNGGKKQGERLFNYATTSVIPGSVLKPIALYAPLIEQRKIRWSTMLDDSPTDVIINDGVETPYPKNAPDVYDGMIDVNDALKRSKNTVAIRLYNLLGARSIFDNLRKNYGFDTLVESGSGVNGERVSDLASAPLALGQLSYGVSLRRLTEAYNAFPAEGILSRGRSYTKVFDRGGKILLESEAYNERILSKSTAQLMNQLLSSVVIDGTARQIRLKELVDVAGKTGTSGSDRDRLFIGYTPYFTAGIWCGYGSSDKPVGHNTPSHLNIWDEVMSIIHEHLIFHSFAEELKSFSTSELIIAPYCSESGLMPNANCELNENTSIRHGYFISDDFPNEECDYCKEYLQSEDSVL